MVDQDIIEEFEEKVLEIIAEICEKAIYEFPRISGESQEKNNSCAPDQARST